jgi:TolA-binding protein
MLRHWILVLAPLWAPLPAQQGAEQAFRDAMIAFESRQFERAATLLGSAAQTDTDNPEVFLWLGRARYELGEFDLALAAWRRTLQLAPAEPLAKRMVATLTGRDLDPERRLQLVEELLGDGLHDAARAECRRIRSEVVLDAGQRARLSLLSARVELARDDGAAAAREIRELVAADPSQETQAEVQLTLGRAEMLLGGPSGARGLSRLRRVASDHAGTPAGSEAELDVLRAALRARNDASGRAALHAWIEAHGDRANVLAARRALCDAHLAAASAIASPEDSLDAEARAALAVAAALWPTVDDAERAQLVRRFLEFFTQRRSDDPRAGIEGLTALRTLGLSTATASEVVRALSLLHTHRALTLVEAALRARAALDGPATAAFQAARASLLELRDHDGERAAVAERLAFAGRLHEFAARAEPDGSSDQLHPCDGWALQLAVEVVGDTPTAAAAAGAAAAAAPVIDAAAARGLQGLRAAAAATAQLVDALDPDRATQTWSEVQGRRLRILDALGRAEIAEMLARGSGTAPTEPTGTQRAMIAAAIDGARRDASLADSAIAVLSDHAAMLASHDRVAVGAGLLLALAQGLPDTAAPAARTAAVGITVEGVLRAREHRAAAGLAVPARLEPELRTALEQLYSLESAVRPAQLGAVRALRARVVDHHRTLGQFEIAEQAIAVRAQPFHDGADGWAELRLARLREERAARDLAAVGAAGIPPEITPAYRAALDTYLGFLARRAATSDLAGEAVDAVFAIAARFESAGGHAAAIVVYGELAAALAALTVPAELRVQRAAQAAFAATAATDARARQLLAESNDGPLSADSEAGVQAALASYADFVAAHPRSAQIDQVVPRQLRLGLAVAQRGAWSAAERLFASIRERGVRQGDRVEFCRAMCLLGPAFRLHALAMLSSAIETDAANAREAAGLALPGATLDATSATRAASVFAADRLAPQPESRRAEESLERDADRILQTVRQLEQQRAQQIAALRGDFGFTMAASRAGAQQDPVVGLTEAEVARIQAVFDSAYAALVALRAQHPESPYAEPARATVFAMIDRWRTLSRWAEAADLAVRYLGDARADAARATLRLGAARDLATFASRPPAERGPVHDTLREVGERFERARDAFDLLLSESAAEPGSEAARIGRWERAATFLTQARTVAQLRPNLARGRFVRAARELAEVAAAHPDHAQAATVPDQLWAIGDELIGLGFHDEVVEVRRELWVRHPTHPLADRAALSIAQVYRGPLGQPLRAAELLQELNFARGGADSSLQDEILAVGLELHAARRWVEALHVLETFVDSFPHHARAGEALAQIGQVHQANGAYPSAVDAYRRVIVEYPGDPHVGIARWSIAECWIHQSDWRWAMDAYTAFQKEYPKDARAAEAGRRIEVLKGLVRYQQVVDEVGQRKAFDAQYQIAVIVRGELGLSGKAIKEFEKVTGRWPESHLADDALFEVGATFLGFGATADARGALLRLAQRYPQSPLADDALYMVGRSFEEEADQLGSVTREDSAKDAQEKAQRLAYGRSQGNVRRFRGEAERRIADLKKEGKLAQAEDAEATLIATTGAFLMQNAQVTAQWASNEAEVLTAAQLADREDRIRAALRRAVASYQDAAQVAGGDKAGEALLRMARIHDERLEDPDAAMSTWLEIVRQYSGTAVAEDASWKIAQFHDRRDDHAAAIEAYQAFLRNYRRSPNAAAAQAAIAENHEQLGEWVHAMDAYTNYINNFPDGPLVERAREQISWIKTYRL